MKPKYKNQNASALTFVEVLVVIATLMVLAAILLPQLTIGHYPAMQHMNCVSNLKQVNLAFRIWEGDNNNQYPMAVSVTNGGAMESINAGNVLDCFHCASNELSTTKILVCPNDSERTYAANFDALNKTHVSYFVGVDANEEHPEMVLDGDDNLETHGVRVKSGLLNLPKDKPVSWIPGRHDDPDRIPYLDIPYRHHYYGNLGFADGSVAEESSDGLQRALQQTGIATNRLAIP
jgi:hypothetical protein